MSGYLSGAAWPGEDIGPRRLQATAIAWDRDAEPSVSFHEAIATTMVVIDDAGRVFALRHDPAPEAEAWVEELDAKSLEVLASSQRLAGGRTWPGGIALHANGDLYVVFGRHAHRLSRSLELLATRELDIDLPYNSFVILDDGRLVTKEFGGVLPGAEDPTPTHASTGVVVLEPVSLEVLERLEIPEASIARLSSDGRRVIVVGTEHVHVLDTTPTLQSIGAPIRYRTLSGQTHGWDPVIALGAAWFLDNGAGSERFNGSFRGLGVSESPLHLVRVDLESGTVALQEICGLEHGLISNPPLIDEQRRIAVGFDSSNAKLVAFDIGPDGSLSPRWQHDQDHAGHLALLADGTLVTGDYDRDAMMDRIVLRDIESGAQLARVDSGSMVQGVLFPAVGPDGSIYYCTFAGVTRLSVS